MQVSLDREGHYTTLQIPEACAANLRSHGVQRLRVTNAWNRLRELDYSVGGGSLGNCTYLNGTWLILSAGEMLQLVCYGILGRWPHLLVLWGWGHAETCQDACHRGATVIGQHRCEGVA